MAKNPSSGMYPFGGPKDVGSKGNIARGVQGTNGRSKPMNKVAAPSKSAPSIAVKLLDTGKTRPAMKSAGTRAGNDKPSKPQRVRPI
jgi:hypothetical protein